MYILGHGDALKRKNMNSLDSQFATTQTLYNSFRNPASPLFLETNAKRIYELAKHEAKLWPVTRQEILNFKDSIETISRDFDSRTLRGRSRYASRRQWLSFAPLSILLGKQSSLGNQRR